MEAPRMAESTPVANVWARESSAERKELVGITGDTRTHSTS
jgi:hypothetical protein